MKVNGTPYTAIWLDDDRHTVRIIDQTKLPHLFEVVGLTDIEHAATAIVTMQVRGAPLIGATAAYGVALKMVKDPNDESLQAAYDLLIETRPTAVNLRWALDDLMKTLKPLAPEARREAAYKRAGEICAADIEICRRIGENGLPIIRAIAEKKKGETVNILTHCNAGWIATVDWGTALAPIYMAHNEGIKVHVWVDETRPRLQGAALTAWELGSHGVPHTIIPDNAGGHLMQLGEVDLCIVGTDRTVSNGDVCNKIGTYLKAVAAKDNNVPFYVALPHTTIDWTLASGRDIPIEMRSETEVTLITGRTENGDLMRVDIAAPGSPAANHAFDVTPARLVTGLITERGVTEASRNGLLALYPEQADHAA